ncbi:hypothetical protein P8625_06835 [Tenacibaculum tangerinum]|uniref:Bacteriocin n=1 Tax=Tenacibaculum tangerinum TaxID=3038772 RepID=A0ABY8L6F7_9FLAO|nr:hypothetical protein [Tenacibaculum tangerinum]WGH76851.1 hypothetical protein P8625_06835 [Tenacibaculum tangerinum]
MKKQILKLGNALKKAEQKKVSGGRNPLLACCGGTGGIIVNSAHCSMGTYGTDYCNGQCWACY